jgi:hypothetical protein
MTKKDDDYTTRTLMAMVSDLSELEDKMNDLKVKFVALAEEHGFGDHARRNLNKPF